MSSRRSRPWACLALAAFLFMAAPGCLGPQHATGHLGKWNNSFENDWAREGIFLVCLPAYVFTYVGDVLIFNSIQWWSGTNPISRPGGKASPTF